MNKLRLGTWLWNYLSCHLRQAFIYTSCSSGTVLCSVLRRLYWKVRWLSLFYCCSAGGPGVPPCALLSWSSCRLCSPSIYFVFAWNFVFSGSGFFVLFCCFVLLRPDLWMPWNSLYRSGWPQTKLNLPVPPECWNCVCHHAVAVTAPTQPPSGSGVRKEVCFLSHQDEGLKAVNTELVFFNIYF